MNLLSKRWLSNLIWIIITLLALWAAEQAFTVVMEHISSAKYYFRIVVMSGIFVTLAVSLNLINGITGQFSLGHAGFYAVGAYASSVFTIHFSMDRFIGSGWQKLSFTEYGLGGVFALILAVIVGAVASGIAGFIVGSPTLRLRGDYLAIATLGFGEIVRILFINTEAVNGPRGLSGIPMLVGFFGVWLTAAMTIAIVRNIMQSAQGLSFLAVREDEIAASAMGVNTTNRKVWAFVIGAACAGAAGALYAHFDGFISPDTFKMEISFIVVTMVVIGGQGSVTGAVLAAVGLTMLMELLRNLPSFNLGGRTIALSDMRMVLFSLALIFVMLFRPQGLLGRGEFGWGVLCKFIAKYRGNR